MCSRVMKAKLAVLYTRSFSSRCSYSRSCTGLALLLLLLLAPLLYTFQQM